MIISTPWETRPDQEYAWFVLRFPTNLSNIYFLFATVRKLWIIGAFRHISVRAGVDSKGRAHRHPPIKYELYMSLQSKWAEYLGSMTIQCKVPEFRIIAHHKYDVISAKMTSRWCQHVIYHRHSFVNTDIWISDDIAVFRHLSRKSKQIRNSKTCPYSIAQFTPLLGDWSTADFCRCGRPMLRMHAMNV